jgi:hypothetical protein
MAKLITFVDNQGRYRTIAPAYYDGTRPAGETEAECLERTWARVVASNVYGIAPDHAHSYVEDSDLRTKVATLGGQDFRYAGKSDSNGRRSGESGAWEMDTDGTPKVNMTKARAVHMDRIRVMRDKELTTKDLELLKAMESGDSSAEATIKTDRQTLRDIPQTFDITTGVDTPEQLKEKWPDGLPKE